MFSYLATLDPRLPLPTLGELVRSGRRVLVFAQKQPSDRYPWDMNAFRWIQDTPLGARKPGQFTCRLNRGRPTSPLLMMNERGLIPNLILTDFYNRGDLIGAVRTLNGLGDQRAAGTIPLNPVG